MSPTRYRHRVPEGGWTGTSARVRFASGARGSNPRDGATYDGLADTTGQPLRPTPWAADLRRFSTTSISTTEGGSSDESYMLVGDFRQCLVGMRTSGINLEVLREGTVTDSSGESWNATAAAAARQSLHAGRRGPSAADLVHRPIRRHRLTMKDPKQ